MASSTEPRSWTNKFDKAKLLVSCTSHDAVQIYKVSRLAWPRSEESINSRHLLSKLITLTLGIQHKQFPGGSPSLVSLLFRTLLGLRCTASVSSRSSFLFEFFRFVSSTTGSAS